MDLDVVARRHEPRTELRTLRWTLQHATDTPHNAQGSPVTIATYTHIRNHDKLPTVIKIGQQVLQSAGAVWLD